MFSTILENRNNHSKKISQRTMLMSRTGNLAYKWKTSFRILIIQTFSISSTKEGAQSSARVISIKMTKINNICSHKLLIKNNKIIQL